jgi:hypothetical protein
MSIRWPRLLYSRTIAIGLAVILVTVVCVASKQFVMPAAQPAKAYPAHDEHSTEGVTVAADPYDLADKASIFSVRYSEEGFLPVFVVVTNDGNQPVSLADMQAQFVTVNRTKLAPSTVDDIYRRLSHPSSNGGRTYPLPFPTKKVKGTVSKQTQDEITNAQFSAKAVEPHSTQAGFMFFDVTGVSTPLPGARLFLSGVRDSKGNELLYFEIPMEKYLSAPQKTN